MNTELTMRSGKFGIGSHTPCSSLSTTSVYYSPLSACILLPFSTMTKIKAYFRLNFFLKTRATLGEFPRSIEAVATACQAGGGGCHSAHVAAHCFISPDHRRPQILSAKIRAIFSRSYKNGSQVKYFKHLRHHFS
jgi:hypothetical protein